MASDCDSSTAEGTGIDSSIVCSASDHHSPVTLDEVKTETDDAVTLEGVTESTHGFRRVHVLETQNNVCLYDHVWQWGVRVHPDKISALVATFSKFAREVAGEDIRRVSFEEPLAAGSGSIDRRRRRHPDKLEMLAVVDNDAHIIVALFHDPARVSAKAAVSPAHKLREVHRAFLSQLADAPAHLAGAVLQASSINGNSDDVRELFAPFTQVLHTMFGQPV